MDDIANFYKNKRIFITGHTGFKGIWLTSVLLSFGAEITGLSLNDEKKKLFNEYIKNKKIKSYFGNIENYNFLKEVIKKSKPQIIFHLAAQSYPQTSFISPIETLQTNIIGTANLLEVLKNSKYGDAKIHVCSSSEIFGKVSKDKLPINEECSIHPASPYAISKCGTDLLGKIGRAHV